MTRRAGLLGGSRLVPPRQISAVVCVVAGVVMVLFHMVGVGGSLQLGRFILDFGRGACHHRRGTGAQAHVFARKDIRK